MLTLAILSRYLIGTKVAAGRTLARGCLGSLSRLGSRGTLGRLQLTAITLARRRRRRFGRQQDTAIIAATGHCLGRRSGTAGNLQDTAIITATHVTGMVLGRRLRRLATAMFGNSTLFQCTTATATALLL